MKRLIQSYELKYDSLDDLWKGYFKHKIKSKRLQNNKIFSVDTVYIGEPHIIKVEMYEIK